MQSPDTTPPSESERITRRRFLGNVLKVIGAGIAASVGIRACDETSDNPRNPLAKPTPTLTTGEQKRQEQSREADENSDFRRWLQTNHPEQAAKRFPTTTAK